MAHQLIPERRVSRGCTCEELGEFQKGGEKKKKKKVKPIG